MKYRKLYPINCSRTSTRQKFCNSCYDGIVADYSVISYYTSKCIEILFQLRGWFKLSDPPLKLFQPYNRKWYGLLHRIPCSTVADLEEGCRTFWFFWQGNSLMCKFVIKQNFLGNEEYIFNAFKLKIELPYALLDPPLQNTHAPKITSISKLRFTFECKSRCWFKLWHMPCTENLSKHKFRFYFDTKLINRDLCSDFLHGQLSQKWKCTVLNLILHVLSTRGTFSLQHGTLHSLHQYFFPKHKTFYKEKSTIKREANSFTYRSSTLVSNLYVLLVIKNFVHKKCSFYTY